MPKYIKCIVWDLDNTLWDGVALEGRIKPRQTVYDTIKTLDQRGILHSIASRGEEELSMKILQDLKLYQYFIVPKINWLPKSTNIICIVESLNISLDTVAFIDDDEFELNQIDFMLPEVTTISSDNASQLLNMPIFNPEYKSKESQSRRIFYQSDKKRKDAEQIFSSREDFLKSCNMQLSVRLMTIADIPRVLELMTRTHQLNTTGKLFKREKLIENIEEKSHNDSIFVAELNDKFGWSGIVGTAITRTTKSYWRLVFFTLSCRILGRGIERSFLTILLDKALKNNHKDIQALLKKTGRNRMMQAMFQMFGFNHKYNLKDQTMVFQIDSNQIPEIPDWVEVV